MDCSELMKKAIEAREKSYSPYSGFAVGAALLTNSGKLFTGANIENAAYPATVCAERVAFYSAVAAGEREFIAIAVAGGKIGESLVYSFPCGCCRQVMAEFCSPEFQIICGISDSDFAVRTLGELLPDSFQM